MKARWTAAPLTLSVCLLSALAASAAVIPSVSEGAEIDQVAEVPSGARLLSIAREIMISAGFATLVTIGESGAPQARVMEPLPPTEDLAVWMGTNPKSRKVGQIRSDPRVTLTYFTPEGPSYVTLHGRARLVDEASEKARHWKPGWEQHYSDRDESFLLIEVTPTKLELISVPHGLTGDPLTWQPDTVELEVESPARSFPESPYRGLESREIKALSSDRIEGLNAGHGLGYAMAAELNRYPGPKHAIELEEALGLNAEQLESLREVFDRMRQAAVEAGRELIEAERSLDGLFAEGIVDTAALEAAVARAAAAEGKVRLAHLRAHLETAAVLDRHQTHLYYRARGHDSGMHHHPGH